MEIQLWFQRACLARRGGDPERLQGVWPFAAWSALSAFVGFWERTGRTTEIANASPTNVIVPMHDYHTGARLVSIAARRPHESIASLLVGIWWFVGGEGERRLQRVLERRFGEPLPASDQAG